MPKENNVSLKITLYRDIQKVAIAPEDIEYNQNLVAVHTGQEWRQADDLKAGDVYQYYLSLVIFHITYNSYNRFRNELARIAGYLATAFADNTYSQKYPYTQGCWDSDGGLLYDLINFSDAEGEIGWTTCNKIMYDLITLKPKLSELSEEHQGYFMDLLEGLEKLKNNKGFIQFS